MRSRTWPLLVIAFGALLSLIAVSGWATMRRTRQIYAEISSLHENYNRTQRSLNEVRIEIHLSGLLVRDFLLDPSHLLAQQYRERLLETRALMGKDLDELQKLIGSEDAPKLHRLREELDRYWDSFEPLFEWTAAQKAYFSANFLRRQVMPRRDAALHLARELRQLNETNLELQRQRIDRKQTELLVYLGRLAGLMLLLGVLIAAGSVYQINRLEQRSDREWRRAETAEQELRRLSQQLVQTQEEERRSISRELHDEVGQKLTALRVELRNLAEVRTAPEQFHAHWADAKRLAEQSLRDVRDLALGLRPSMLDDLGLGPALEWQARDFSRRFGVPVTVQIDGALEALPDAYRTCAYRIVQEALTNCARHAHASDIRVTLHGGPGALSITIQDDGAGFDPAESRGRGMGLIGIQERVRELGGQVSIIAHPGKGTLLAAEIPLPKAVAV